MSDFVDRQQIEAELLKLDMWGDHDLWVPDDVLAVVRNAPSVTISRDVLDELIARIWKPEVGDTPTALERNGARLLRDALLDSLHTKCACGNYNAPASSEHVFGWGVSKETHRVEGCTRRGSSDGYPFNEVWSEGRWVVAPKDER